MGKCAIVTFAKVLAVVTAVLLAIMIGSSQIMTSEVQDAADRFKQRDDLFQRKALEFQMSVVQVQQWLTDISATRGLDGLNDGFDEAAKHAGSAQKLIPELSQLDGGNQAFYTELKATFENFYATGKKMAGLYVDQGPAGGNPFMASFDSAAEAMSTKVDTLVESADQRKSATLEMLNEKTQTSSTIIMALSVLLGIAITGGLLFLIKLLKPLHDLRDISLAMSENDFSKEIKDIKGEHEVSLLTRAFQTMQRNLRESLGEINSGASIVGQRSKEIHTLAGSSRDNVLNQQAEVDQVATAINQMSATIQEISRNTSGTADAARHASAEVENGSSVINTTTESINRLADEVTKGVEAIQQVEKESGNIGTVLDVIKGIAEQTNLLALNAAIEAARAGEQGRGFAVVADEVRTLASRTQNSTQEIQEMIERLQAGSKSAVGIMKQGQARADETVKNSAAAGDSLASIRNAVSTITDMSTQIASAAEEQSLVSEEINRNIQSIKEAADSTSEMVDETFSSVQHLDDQAMQLRGVVAKFAL